MNIDKLNTVKFDIASNTFTFNEFYNKLGTC